MTILGDNYSISIVAEPADRSQPGKVVIERTDDRVETIKIKALDGDGSDISVEITVEKDGRLISSEKT